MARNVVKAKLDIIFKKLFTSDDTILTSFLEDILDLPKGSITKTEILNPAIIPSTTDGKQGVLDLKINVDDKIVNVEIQMKDEGNFKDRSVFYWSKIYSGDLKKGQEYDELKQTITINILNFNLFPDSKEPYSSFKLMETSRHEVLTDKCLILFFELKKIGKNIDSKDRKRLWLQLINAETEEELDMLNETGVPEIQKAVVILHEMSEDEQVQEMARLREKWILDENSAIKNAERRGEIIGEKRGEKRGEKKKETEMIAKMRKSGMSEEQIKNVLNS